MRRNVLVVLVLALVLGLGTDGLAQQPQSGTAPLEPLRRLALGPGAADNQDNAQWILIFSGFGGYENTNLQEELIAVPSADPEDTFSLSGMSNGGSARFGGSFRGRRGGVSLGGSTTSVYYPRSEKFMTDASVGISEWLDFKRHFTFTAAQNVAYAPYYSIGIFPGVNSFAGSNLGVPFESTFEGGIKAAKAYRYDTVTRLTDKLTDRTDISGGFTLAANGVPDASSATNAFEIDGRLSHMMNRSVGYHIGYSFGNARFGGRAEPVVLHNIDVGLDVSKALSLTRRTKFSFSTGSVIYKSRPLEANSSLPRTDFRVIGDAQLSHFIGRTWSAGLAYRRSVEVLDGTVIPYFSDGVTAAIGGTLNRKTSLGVNTSWVAGTPLAATISRASDRAMINSAWFEVQVSSAMTVYAQYSRYGQRFTFEGLSELDLPRQFNRNSVRAGLTLVLRARARER